MDDTAEIDRGLTEKILNAYSHIDDARLKLVVSDLIKHPHAYIKETKVMDEEFEFAWEFLAKMAEKTSPERNEFILLADVIGVSQFIEILNHEEPDQPVGFALVGPFYRADAPFRRRVGLHCQWMGPIARSSGSGCWRVL